MKTLIRFAALQSKIPSLFVTCLAWFCPVVVTATPSGASLEHALKGSLGDTAACVMSLDSAKELYSHRAEVPVKPASVQKLITTAAVFSRFGPESHFATELYAAQWRGGEIGTLYLRGLGDPVLTIESLSMLARSVRQHGITRIGELFFDDSLFQGGKEREGQRAYLGGTSALAFDFNAVSVVACPSTAGHQATISVEPFEAGLVATGKVTTASRGNANIAVSELNNGSYSVSGQVIEGGSCSSTYRSVSSPAALAAEFFRRQLAAVGIKVPAVAKSGAVPKDAKLFEHAASKPLHEVVWGMNHWSTNVIAEQLLMSLGNLAGSALDDLPLGTKLNREIAVAKLNAFAMGLSPSTEPFSLVDGSGLSHENKVPASLFCNLLVEMQKRPNQRVEFEHSLPVSGRSGTLKDRDFDLPTGMVRAKTGTLDGVSSLAGYIITRLGNKYAFAIIQNSSRSKGEAVTVEDRFVRALYDDGN